MLVLQQDYDPTLPADLASYKSTLWHGQKLINGLYGSKNVYHAWCNRTSAKRSHAHCKVRAAPLLHANHVGLREGKQALPLLHQVCTKFAMYSRVGVEISPP